jgi:hypothetical protein
MIELELLDKHYTRNANINYERAIKKAKGIMQL